MVDRTASILDRPLRPELKSRLPGRTAGTTVAAPGLVLPVLVRGLPASRQAAVTR